MQYCDHFFIFPSYLSWSIAEHENLETKAHILPSIYLYLACEKKEEMFLSCCGSGKFINPWLFDNRLMSSKVGVEKAGWWSNTWEISY